MRFVHITIFACSLLGCGQLDEVVAPEFSMKAAFDEMDRAFSVRVDLAQTLSDRPAVDYRSLLASGAVTSTTDRSGTSKLSASLRRALLTTTRERLDRLTDAVVRVQRFKLNQNFEPLKLLSESANSVLPFRIDVGGEIEFARLFKSEQAERDAVPFSLLDYPHDAESALRLPVGTIVTIPVKGKVSFDVNGRFLTTAQSASKAFVDHVSASAVGTTSASRQGSVVGEGHFSLQLIRLEGDQVRARLSTAETFEVDARVTGHALAHASFVFLPATRLDRLRVFRRRLDQLAGQVSYVRDIDTQIEMLRESLPQLVRNTFDAFFIGGHHSRAVRERIVATIDPVLEAAHRTIEAADVLDEKIGRHVDKALKSTQSFWDAHIEPVTARIQNLTSRAFHLSGSIQLEDGLSRRLNRLGDFVFDLSNEDARIALEHMISGRAMWRGTQALYQSWGRDIEGLVDLVLAHEIAAEDRGQPNPRVRVLAHAEVDRRRRKQQIKVSGLGLNVGLHGHFDDNRIELVDEHGERTRWLIRSWERGRHHQFRGDFQSESFASGAFSREERTDTMTTAYWYRWRKTYHSNAPQPIADTLRHVLNDLGPLAMHFGVPDLYQGEFDGPVDADLFVAFHGPVIEFLFNAEVMNESTLWRTFASMMPRYERPFFLPYAHAPIRPARLHEVEGAAEGCEAVAQRLGGRYCYSLVDRIIPALRRAQQSSDASDRLAFFESFYRVPAGGAVLSTRTLGRLMAELAYGHDLADHVTMKLVIRNRNDDAEAASPTLVVGQPNALALGEATLLDGLFFDGE